MRAKPALLPTLIAPLIAVPLRALPATAERPTCVGQAAKVWRPRLISEGKLELRGTDSDEVIVGTDARESIFGGHG